MLSDKITEILNTGTNGEIRALFEFGKEDTTEDIKKKFQIWGRWFFPKYFESPDAPFHKEMDERNVKTYQYGGKFLNIAFRGSAKSTRTKLFVAFTIACDKEHYRKYYKVLSKDMKNAKQATTDVYNMLISPRVKAIYPEIFEKTETKREETMASFTTATGVKMISDSIGTDQRGDIQETSRPDFIWFDDFETNVSITSAVVTHTIWLRMNEALDGLAMGGAVVFTCNYISERGNVHKLVERLDNKMITPIEENGEPTWRRYNKGILERLKKESLDYEGEYLCKPSAGKDVYFDREAVDRQVSRIPVDEISGFKIFKKYNPAHRIGSGHDVAAGVGLDSSTSVFIDFDTFPIQVVATYKNNEIKPDDFAHEIVRQAKYFGENYVAVEKNYGSTLDLLKTIYPTSKIHRTQKKPKIVFQCPTEYGWETNKATKQIMLTELQKYVNDGLIDLNDKDLIAEVRSYTRNDLMDAEVDARLTTRHWDLLMALAIALQTNQYIPKKIIQEPYNPWSINNIFNKSPRNPAR